MAKLSVVISAFNEEKNIKDCLESVKWTDEIVLIDNTSTDKTLEIAKRYTDKIFIRPNNPMLNINKNFGFEKATGEWILNLDADERVTEELKKEIQRTIGQLNNRTIDGFWIPRKNIIFGKWIRHTGWYPDHQLRLFRRGKGRFAEKHVHEMLAVEGEIGYFKGHLLHLNYTTVSQFLYKLSQIYTPNEAQNILDSGKKLVWQDALKMPSQEFFHRFFIREGWKDGLHGLVLSLLMAFYYLVVFTQVWEKQGFAEKEFSIREITGEFEESQKRLNYWLRTTQISQTRGLRQLILRILRKLRI